MYYHTIFHSKSNSNKSHRVDDNWVSLPFSWSVFIWAVGLTAFFQAFLDGLKTADMSVSFPKSRYFAHSVDYTLPRRLQADNMSLLQGYNSAYHKHGRWKAPHVPAVSLERSPCVWQRGVCGSWSLFCRAELHDRQKRWFCCSWELVRIWQRPPAHVRPSLLGDPECPAKGYASVSWQCVLS